MAEVLDDIDERLAAWIGRQPMFFVGSAPLAGDGHVNVSPKGMAGTFAVLGEHRVAYLDYTGSGTETVAHLLAYVALAADTNFKSPEIRMTHREIGA